MENQKNLFLAIIISMAIIFGFQLLVPQPERLLILDDINAYVEEMEKFYSAA